MVQFTYNSIRGIITLKSSTAVQKSGWIVWWINTVISVLTLILTIFLIYHIPNTQFSPQDKAFTFIVWMFMLFFLVIIQLLAYFMIKYLHRDNSYIYPIILIVLGFCGYTLYLIPGIWGVIYANHLRLNP